MTNPHLMEDGHIHADRGWRNLLQRGADYCRLGKNVMDWAVI